MLGISAALLLLVLLYGRHAADVVSIPQINEICTVNFSVAADPNEEYLDYLELYNPLDTDYSMDGLWLSDDRDEPQRCDLTGITVPAHGYVILWMIDEIEAAAIGMTDTVVQAAPTQEESQDVTTLTCAQYYCPFDLSKKGDYVYISNRNGRILESIRVPALTYNVAYGRTSDGIEEFAGMTPTPGASNDSAELVELGKAEEPVLSAESGFYEDAFDLTITHAIGTDVYYTLDGSTPTTASTLYEGPITIDDPSGNENVYSAHDDIYDHNYTPEEHVDKAAVVRAIAVDRSTGVASDVVSRTYFVGYEDKSDYDDMAVVSIITDPDNLYDHDTGIYVMGAAYDLYKEKGGFEALTSSQVPGSFSDSSGHHYRYMYTNAEHRGREWERLVTVEVFDAAHQRMISQDAGLRIAGESTRYNVHKSLNLFARSIYGEDSWSGSLWGYETDTVRLRASGGETIRWKETFVQSLNVDRANGIQRSMPCAVFVDGEYWGLYQLTEQYTSEYFAAHYGVAEEDLTIYKNHEITQGDATQAMADYEGLEEIITTYDMSADNLYQLAADRINMTSLIDYFCANTYLSNVDIVAHHNQEMWRSEAEGQDHRWQYVIYDMDQTCDDAAHNTIADYREREGFYWPGYLCANARFREQYVTTMMDLANVEYSYQRVHALLEDKASELAVQSIETKRRYERADYDETSYAADVEQLDSFFRDRRSYIEQYLQEDLGLGDIAQVTVTNTDVEGGAIKVNSSTLTSADYVTAGGSTAGTWTGDYFTDYSVTLTATPVEGYTFVGWTGDVDSADATITVPLTADGVSVQAEFVRQ